MYWAWCWGSLVLVVPKVARVWDVRTARSVHCLGGHGNTIGSVLTNAVDPQIVTGGYDNMIRLWDLAAGKVCVCRGALFYFSPGKGG